MPFAVARPGGVPCCCCGVSAPTPPWLLAADDGRRLPLPADGRPPPPLPPRGLLLTLGRPGVLSGLLAAVSPTARRVMDWVEVRFMHFRFGRHQARRCQALHVADLTQQLIYWTSSRHMYAQLQHIGKQLSGS